MASRIIVECNRCGQPFSVIPSVAHKAKYCSRDCYVQKYDSRPCAICGDPLPESRLRDENARFCSAKCRGVFVSQQGAFHPPVENRFWAKVDKTPGYGPKGDCWRWTGTLDKDGYGRFRDKGKTIKAHIFSYKLHKGDFQKGPCVLHRCDMRDCSNPAHLWLGDNAANTADMIAKGRDRHLFGEECVASRLTEEQALAILRDDYHLQSELAEMYGISRAAVCMLKKRKTWKHLQP